MATPDTNSTNVVCPQCGNANVIQTRALLFVRCQHCSTTFANPQLTYAFHPITNLLVGLFGIVFPILFFRSVKFHSYPYLLALFVIGLFFLTQFVQQRRLPQKPLPIKITLAFFVLIGLFSLTGIFFEALYIFG